MGDARKTDIQRPQRRIGDVSVELIATDSPEMQQAHDLALRLTMHCKKHNLPNSLIIGGVATDAAELFAAVKEQGYQDGKQYERNRIKCLLGLD